MKHPLDPKETHFKLKKSIFRVKKSVFGLFLKKITNIFLSYQFAWTTNIAKNLPEVKNQKKIKSLAV